MDKLTFRNNDVFDLIAKIRYNARMYSLLDTNIKYTNNEYKEYCNKEHGFSYKHYHGKCRASLSIPYPGSDHSCSLFNFVNDE